MKNVRKACQNMKFVFKAQSEVYPLFFVYAVALGVIRCLVMAVQIILPKEIVDLLVGGHGDRRLLLLVIGYAAVSAILIFLSSIFTRLQQKSGYYLPHSLLLKLSQKMLRIDYADVESREFNEAYTNAENAVFKLTSKGDEVIRLLFSAVMEFVMIVTIVATLDIGAVLIVIASAVLQILLDSRANQNEQQYRKSINPQFHGKAYPWCTLIGHFPGIKDIMTFDGQEMFLGKLEKAGREVQGKYKEKLSVELKVRSLQYLLKATEIAAVYCLMIHKFHSGALSAGSLLMYVSAANELKEVLNIILAAMLSVNEADIYMSQYRDIINRPEKMRETQKAVRKLSDAVKDNVSPEIEFCNVYFRYSPDLPYVLKNVNFVLKPGEKLVLVGENGAGKSTLIKLLTRLYDVSEGCIKVNGIDIREFDYEEYQKLFAAVFQDYQLFDCSVRENVGFDRAETDRVRDVLQRVGLEKFSDKLERKIHNEGGDMSGGERQMTAISRAIYKGAAISIFDEVTSAIDPLRESAIYKEIVSSAAGRSIVYISHRLSVCTSCNQVIVLNDGEIVEKGTHSELMRKGGIYAEMFNRQAERYM